MFVLGLSSVLPLVGKGAEGFSQKHMEIIDLITMLIKKAINYITWS